MITPSPLVSVGLPVFNEEKFLEETLESLLTQDYKNFEIIISNNASTDLTPKICEKYAKNYRKIIKYTRNAKNIGSVANFSKVFKLSQGDFFMWAGAHDLYNKNYISASVEIMQNEQNVIVVYPQTVWIGYDGSPLNKISGFVDTRGSDIVSRFNQIMWANHSSIYGLMQSNMLKQTRLSRQTIVPGDLLFLLGELSLLGDFAFSPNVIWYRRENREKETFKQRRRRYRNMLGASNKSLRSFFPHWRIPFEYFIVIWKSSVSFRYKIELTLSGIPAALIRYAHGMIKDVLFLFSK